MHHLLHAAAWAIFIWSFLCWLVGVLMASFAARAIHKRRG